MASRTPTKRGTSAGKSARQKTTGKTPHAKSPAKRAPRKVAPRGVPTRAAARPERAARPMRPAGVAAPSAAEVADLLREANASLNALLALEPMVAPEDEAKHLRAQNAARRARARLELAQFEALLDEQKAALPDLVDRTRQLKEDLENAQDAVAAVNAISAALGLFAEILKLLPALA